ncbi:unnamed protein product [Aspergillus oryzae RIB40]|uniref:DNA, SC010 n=1 Tax=Aspergillus oryzae (strain ATCC 42149 / RIB 40) TaxID=510516 RepID=Q2TWS0_ASPOR|nr:unnamed protein product [Aspergillus oryzae RIB40]BAE66303.1 unnamed protein product [Aspergillus oryzae RIB40]
MNVFPEKRGTISLFASKGQREGAIVAVILEELKLPYHLYLDKKLEDIGAQSFPVLRNTQSDGESVNLSGFHDVVSYLITRYDTAHDVSYKKGSKEDEEVNRLVASLTEPNAAHPEERRFDLDAKDDIPFARKAIITTWWARNALLRTSSTSPTWLPQAQLVSTWRGSRS